MKKNVFKLSFLMMLAFATSMTLSSCGGDADHEEGMEQTDNGKCGEGKCSDGETEEDKCNDGESAGDEGKKCNDGESSEEMEKKCNAGE